MKHLFSKHYWADKDIQLLIGKQLRLGVIMSSTLVLIGGLIYLYRHGAEMPSYREFTGVRAGLDSFSGIIHGVRGIHGMEIIQLGVVCLIATPILRVALSVFAFLLEKDYLYVILTLIVLGVILFSMLGDLAG
ncbi:DUF1634 domain-containing protein [Chitinophaga sp. Cy-1792]|uniref:DUF1634 domain-containing protein n=1 Tax=Chitinophaga sp. Cy-1792 TaxID=2608339 RepID=UPI001420C83B|nr:DUF1634 domain-containing protein [Chitinophaga sp. Cy-1792]NIG53073.1 DUF1634 domain-containing protein [Chitinophaga sp. Cy-1792]